MVAKILTPSEKSRARRYQYLYDISLEDYEAVLQYQGGGCAVCGRPPGKTRLAVDHDHKTGAMRGLLCTACNMKLSERITVEWMTKACEYLSVPPVGKALGRTPIGRQGRVSRRRKRKKELN